jgi:homocysteine S-methyltransferase
MRGKADGMGITILDGGMGQELVARSGREPTGLWSTQVMLDRPELVRAIHDDFFAAGAEIATANTYAIHRDRLEGTAHEGRFEELHRSALAMARAARDAHGSGRVAGALGPLGWSYDPAAAPPPERAAPLYAEIAALHAPEVDLLLIETMSSVEQARGALMGALGAGLPVWLAVTVDDADGTRLRSGEPVEAVLGLAAALPFDALLVNCSTPEAVSAALPRLAGAPMPLGAYANGFTGIARDFKRKGATVRALEARSDLGPEAYADFAGAWAAMGATIIGGCCEVGPAHIRALAARLAADRKA